MKAKINEFQTGIWLKTEARLKRLCGKPSPGKRLAIVLVVGLALAAANIYFVASSIYRIGKRDAGTEWMKMQHIETLKPQSDKDSLQSIMNYKLKIKRNEYE